MDNKKYNVIDSGFCKQIVQFYAISNYGLDQIKICTNVSVNYLRSKPHQSSVLKYIHNVFANFSQLNVVDRTMFMSHLCSQTGVLFDIFKQNKKYRNSVYLELKF